MLQSCRLGRWLSLHQVIIMDITTDTTQYAWGVDNHLTTEEYEELITMVHNKIKKEYSDDETYRFYSKLLGKLLVLANNE